MKNLIFVNGPMGVGKSATCEVLLDRLGPTAYLDGDWCWMMKPWIVNERTISMVERNIVYMLKQYISLPDVRNVIFGWVMHRADIVNRLLSELREEDLRISVFTLICSPDALRHRIGLDIKAGKRSEDNLRRSLERLPLYADMPWPKIDVSTISAEQAALMIVRQLPSSAPLCSPNADSLFGSMG